MIVYKLTNARAETSPEGGPLTKWEIGKPNRVKDTLVPCKNGLHAYASLELAGRLDVWHGRYLQRYFHKSYRVFKCRTRGKVLRETGKLVCRELIPIEEITVSRRTFERHRMQVNLYESYCITKTYTDNFTRNFRVWKRRKETTERKRKRWTFA